MKFKPISTALWSNYIFLALGVVCLLILPVTVNSWLGYIDDGYGIEVETGPVQYWQSGDSRGLLMTFTMDNPGSFDAEIINGTFNFTDAAGNNHSVKWYPDYNQRPLLLARKEVSNLSAAFELPDATYAALSSGGWTMDATFILYIEPRDAWVPLTFRHTEAAQ